MSEQPLLLYNQLKREKADFQVAFFGFLCAMHCPDSPTRLLRGQDDVARLIYGCAVHPNHPQEHPSAYKYQVNLPTRTITAAGACPGEGMVLLLEAIHERGGWNDFNVPLGEIVESREWCGRLVSGGCTALDMGWIASVAWHADENGDYLTEGALRRRWKQQHCCCCGLDSSPSSSSTETSCQGFCCAMLGDTIYWKIQDSRPVATRWEPATNDHLRELATFGNSGVCPMHLYTLSKICSQYRQGDYNRNDKEYDEDMSFESDDDSWSTDKDSESELELY